MLGLFNENFIGFLYFGLIGDCRYLVCYQQNFIELTRHDAGIGNGLCKNV